MFTVARSAEAGLPEAALSPLGTGCLFAKIPSHSCSQRPPQNGGGWTEAKEMGTAAGLSVPLGPVLRGTLGGILSLQPNC